MNEELYNEECYPGMTVRDAERMDNLNRKNHYGLSRYGQQMGKHLNSVLYRQNSLNMTEKL